MTHERFLTIARAARLVGVRQGELRRRVREGELSLHDGMIDREELLTLYSDRSTAPHADDVEQLVRHVLDAPAEERGPLIEAMAERIREMGHELAVARSQLHLHQQLVERLQLKLASLARLDEEGSPLRNLSDWFSSHVEGVHQEAGSLRAMEAEDAFLRVVAAHVRTLPDGRGFFVEGADSLLRAGLRAGIPLAYGCRDGRCGRCSAQLVSGRVRGLEGYQPEDDRLLLCRTTAVTDLIIETEVHASPDRLPLQQLGARIHRAHRLQGGVLLLEVRPDEARRLQYLAGQRVKFSLDDVETEFSIASCPCEEHLLQFHVPLDHPVVPHLQEGATARLEGPRGEFVLDADSPRPARFLCWGSGFAPVKGLVEHALSMDIMEAVEVHWWADSRIGHYMANLCRSWSDAFTTVRCILHDAEAPPESLLGDLEEEVTAWDYYLAGPSAALERMTALLHNRGVAENQIRQERLDTA